MDYLIKKNRTNKGLKMHVLGKKQGLKYIDFGLLNLAKGQEFNHYLSKKETVIVILSGACTLGYEGKLKKNLGKRENVFAERATAIYIPPGKKITIKAQSNFSAAVAFAPSTNTKKLVQIVNPNNVQINRRGRGNWKREVHDIIDHRTSGARLIVGETYNPPGNWSSYPPHKHEREIPGVESKHEELYYFKINPQQGFGLMRCYNDKGRDQTVVVEDGDTVLLPNGYHPVVAAPGYQLYYLWILAGKNQNYHMHDDPRHAWIRGK